MTTHHDDDRIDRYLDDLMSDEERAAFESELESDAALRRTVELQESIDGRIRAIFEPAQSTALPIEHESRAIPLWRRPVFGVAIAAAVLLSVSAVVLTQLSTGNTTHREIVSQRSYITPVEYFGRVEVDGFQISWRCENDEQFAEVTQEHLGVPVLIRPAEGLEVAGWRYSSGYEYVISSETLTLITEFESEPVLVLLDTRTRAEHEADRKQLGEPEGELNLFRRELGDVVMIELSRRDAPALLESFYIPE